MAHPLFDGCLVLLSLLLAEADKKSISKLSLLFAFYHLLQKMDFVLAFFFDLDNEDKYQPKIQSVVPLHSHLENVISQLTLVTKVEIQTVLHSPISGNS